MTPAGRLQLVQDLLGVPVVNDDGEVVGHEALITLDEARALLLCDAPAIADSDPAGRAS